MLEDESDSRPHPETVMVSPTKVSPTSDLAGRQIGLAYSESSMRNYFVELIFIEDSRVCLSSS